LVAVAVARRAAGAMANAVAALITLPVARVHQFIINMNNHSIGVNSRASIRDRQPNQRIQWNLYSIRRRLEAVRIRRRLINDVGNSYGYFLGIRQLTVADGERHRVGACLFISWNPAKHLIDEIRPAWQRRGRIGQCIPVRIRGTNGKA